MRISDNHIILSSAKDIQQICKPLFELFGITFFCFLRVYQDGSRACLTSNSARTKFLFETDYRDSTNYKKTLFQSKSGFAFWHDQIHFLPPKAKPIFEQKIRDGRNLFNIDNGITLFNRYPEYTDYYNFGTTANNTLIFHFYLNNLDILEKFTCFFNDKAQKLIQLSVSNKIIIPRLANTKNIKMGNGLPMENINFKRSEFINQISHQRHFIHYQGNDFHLTARELECLKLLARGKTLKETGKILNISYRTVEYFMEKIKEKFNCPYFSTIIDFYWDSNL